MSGERPDLGPLRLALRENAASLVLLAGGVWLVIVAAVLFGVIR